MKAYKATFLKKSTGALREMNFVKVEDLPQSFLKTKIGPDPAEKRMSEGSELVWDLDKSDFRVFNWNTKVGEAVESIIDEKRLAL